MRIFAEIGRQKSFNAVAILSLFVILYTESIGVPSNKQIKRFLIATA
jgi:hypothetical protein